jgi:D-beta-D-heptose 7-phosphate kinase/D-beta-D-heptose 1-phosphate adenosyltransferase
MDKREILYRKILNQVELKRRVAFWRYKDQRITMAYGAFDMLKPGNVDLLIQAANKGEALLVAIRSDEYIKSQKGDGNPIHNQFNRAYMLASQLLVSGICVVEKDEVSELINMVRPVAIAFCKHAPEGEKEIFRKVKDWNGEAIEVDTDIVLEEPAPANETAEG